MRNTAAAAAPVPLLTLDEVSEIYRLKPATIRKKLNKGAFCPPCAEFPYRWHADDVADDLTRSRAAGKLRQRQPVERRPATRRKKKHDKKHG
jgi:hypothetical protein